MANKSTTTTYLEIESIGADKLITTMAGLQKSMNFVAGMLKDLNKGLGITAPKVDESAKASRRYVQELDAAISSTAQLRIAMAAQNNATTELASSVAKLTKAQAEQNEKQKAVDWTAIKSKIDLAVQAYNTVKSAIIGVGQEALRLSQAWDIQRQAENQLQQSLLANEIGGNIEVFKEWAGQIQATTTAGDELVLSLASQAARFAGSEENTKKATKAALDFASATGGSADQALKSMGKAAQGNGESLRQLGIYLSDAEKEQFKNASTAERMTVIIEKLEKNYGGFAEQLAKTPTGALTQVQNILGDIDEEVGRLVSPALYAGLSVVKDYLLGQQAELQKISGDAGNIRQIQMQIVSGLATAFDIIVDFDTVMITMKNSVEILAEAFQAAFSAPLKPIGLFVEAMSKIPFLSQDMKNALSDVALVISAPFDAAVQGIGQDINDIEKRLENAKKLKREVRESLETAGAAMIRASGATQKNGASSGKVSGSGATSPAKPQAEDYGISFEMQLDASTQAYLDYEQKLLDIKKEYTEKRMALEASTDIDVDYKIQQAAAYEVQEQEAIRQVKLQYAQATGDEIAILEDQYRQDRITKEKAAQEELAEQQKATMQALAGNLKTVAGVGLDMLTGLIEGTGDWRAQLYDAMKSFSTNLMQQSLASIIDQALVNQAKAQGSQAGIPIVGPILALAAGAAMFATTMALKSKLKPAEVKYATGGYISAGMVRGGAYGRDSVPALLEPGERVLSKAETEAYDSRQQAQNIVINVNVSGQLSTPAQVTDTVRRVLVPELRAAVRAGYSIG